jgi:hypothetical protein
MGFAGMRWLARDVVARTSNNNAATKPKDEGMNDSISTGGLLAILAARDGGGGGGSFLGTLFYLAIVILVICAFWKVFTKAGHPGWAALIPIYNLYVLCKIAGKPGWWVILLFIPIVQIVIGILVALGVAERFGKGAGFGIGLALLPIIFYPILAFSDAVYSGPAV